MTINLSLPHDLEQKIYNEVNKGFYENPNEVVIEALNNFFAEPTEGQVLAYFTEKRKKEIEENNEEYVEFDVNELKQIRKSIEAKYIHHNNEQ